MSSKSRVYRVTKDSVLQNAMNPNATMGGATHERAGISKPAAYAGWARVDGDNVLRGWVTDRNDPQRRLSVGIYIDGVFIASLVASRRDSKLVELGEGDGRYAFAILVPTAYRDGQDHRFEVRTDDAGFVLKAKNDIFNIPKDASLPTIKIKSVGIGGVRGRITGGQYGRLVPLDVWSGGALVDLGCEVIWTGSHGNMEFFCPFTEAALIAMTKGDIVVAGSGMIELGLAGGTIRRLSLSLAVESEKPGEIAFQVKSSLPISENEKLEARVYRENSEAPIHTEIFQGAAGKIRISPGVAMSELRVAVLVNGARAPELVGPVRKSFGLLTRNDCFQAWTSGGPQSWSVTAATGAVSHGYYAFPQSVAEKYQVTGDVFEIETPPGEDIVLLSQPITAALSEGDHVDSAIMARSDHPAVVRMRVVDSAGSELGSTVLEIKRSWSWAFVGRAMDISSPPDGDVRVEVLVRSSEPVCLNLARATLGARSIAADDANDLGRTNSNLVVNASLRDWPHGIVVDHLVGRGEIASGWFGFNKRASTPIAARAILDDTEGEGVALAIATQSVTEYGRLEVRLDRQVAEISEGLVQFDIGSPLAARRLLKDANSAPAEFVLVDRLFILKRAMVERASGFEMVETVLAKIGRRVLTTRPYQSYSFAFELDQPAQTEEFDWDVGGKSDESAEYFLVFEFREPFAIAVRNLTVKAATQDCAQPSAPYLALEDRGISAQAPHVIGLESWVGEELATTRAAKTGQTARKPLRWRWSAGVGTVEIVICVHNAIEATMACLNSMIGATEIPHTVRIIDDGSEPTVAAQLADFVSDKPWIMVSTNDGNRGYTYSADKGVRESEAEWVVLLNSDTIVTNRWLEGLIECALADSNTAFVGPLSNSATFQSVPHLYDGRRQWKTNDLPQSWSPDDMAKTVADASIRSFPDVPLLNGFCTLMKRSVFLELGGFNHHAFPSGYGEENDLCLRATKAGYKLAIADHTYVYHSKSASFGTKRRMELSKDGARALRRLHPDVDLRKLTENFREIPALVALRSALDRLGEGRSER